jgi:hypothetical protein
VPIDLTRLGAPAKGEGARSVRQAVTLRLAAVPSN